MSSVAVWGKISILLPVLRILRSYFMNMNEFRWLLTPCVPATIGKRLSQINVENVEENRRAYRELLFSCGQALNEHVSGVILFHETIYQKASNGQTMIQLLKANGIIPGIKVDTGTVPLAGTDGECTTQGRSLVESSLLFQ